MFLLVHVWATDGRIIDKRLDSVQVEFVLGYEQQSDMVGSAADG